MQFDRVYLLFYPDTAHYRLRSCIFSGLKIIYPLEGIELFLGTYTIERRRRVLVVVFGENPTRRTSDIRYTDLVQVPVQVVGGKTDGVPHAGLA